MAFEMHGDLVRRVRFAGETFDAVVNIDDEELSRRGVEHLAAVLDRDLLAALASLPHGLPVRWNDLDPWDRTVLSAAPTGLVDDSGGHAVRLWRPALRVEGVIVATRRDWKSAVTAAGWFWCDARRGAVVTGEPPSLSKAIAMAQRHNVGLAVAEAGGITVLTPAAKAAPVPGPRHWRFLETCYASWSEQARTHADK